MGSDNISSDALLLLLETVNKQAGQIKRLEAIVSGDTYGSSDTGARHGGDRTHKQLLQLQSSLQSLEQQQAASASTSKALSEQLHRMEQRIQQLEAQGRNLQQQGQQLQQQLGSPAQNRPSLQSQHRIEGATYARIMPSAVLGASGVADDPQHPSAPAHASAPAGRSMAARLTRLEQQVEALEVAATGSEEKLQSTTSALQALDDEVEKQLHNMRADVKQAITVASSSLRADVEAAVAVRHRDDAAQLQEQLKGLSSDMEALLANRQHTVILSLTDELDRRMASAQEATDGRIAAVRSQLDRLEEEKADISLVTQYTGQVADVFEQLATTVADSTQASIAQLMTQQQELRSVVTNLSASKADSSSLLQHQQHCQQQLLELQRGLAAAQSAASDAAVAAAVAKTALEPVDALRLQLAETQGTVAALQATSAGLEATFQSSCNEQQQQAQQLQQLASCQHMLQQQLLALCNHVDPAAAAQLAAAAAGDESALTFQPFGPLSSAAGSLVSNPVFEGLDSTGLCEEGWAAGSYLQMHAASGAGHAVPGGQRSTSGSGAGGQPSNPRAPSGATAAGAACDSTGSGTHPSRDQIQPAAADAGGPAAAGTASIGSSCNGDGTPGTRAAAAGRGFVDRMSVVLRHLPVAVRLLRLETAVRDLSNALGQKASAGEVQGLQQQLESISARLISGLNQLEGVSSSSMQHLQEQAATLADAVAAVSNSVSERPTHNQVQQAAAAAGWSTVQPLQEQLTKLSTQVDAVSARLRGTGQEVQHLKDWQECASKQLNALQQAEQQVQHMGQKLQHQVAADLSRQQQEVQEQLSRHTAEVTKDALKQLRADQEALQGSAEAHARVASLESKLKVVVAELDRMQDQAALTARLQDKHTDMMAALEAALSAQSSKYATVSQQLRLELKEAVAKASQVQSTRVAALEESLKQQSGVLAELAAAVAELPSKGGLLEAAVKGARATVGELLAQHKRQEEGRWEVWLAEFARAIEQRPTAAQLQRQLKAVQAAAENSVQDAAAERIQCVTAAMEAGLRQQLRTVLQQLGRLRDRTQALEQGTGIGEDYDDTYDVGVAGPDSPGRAQRDRSKQVSIGRPTQHKGGIVADDADSCKQAPSKPDATAAVEAAAEASQVNVAAIVAAFEGSPPPPLERPTCLVRAGADEPCSEPHQDRRNAAAMGSAIVTPQPAAAADSTAAASASPRDAHSSVAADTSPSAKHWRQIPVASSVLAEAAGAAAATAASPGGDSSVAARREGGSTSTTTTASTEASSIGSSCNADSTAPAAAVLAQPSAATASDAGAAGMQLAVSESFSASGPTPSQALGGGLRQLQAPQQQRDAGPAVMTDSSELCAATDLASPSVTSLSPQGPVGKTAGSSGVTSRPRPSVPRLRLPAIGPPNALAAYSAAAATAASSSSTPPPRGPSGAPSGQQLSLQRALTGTTDTTECASELQQLLDLQQQVQQCLMDSGCVAVGRRAKAPKQRPGKQGQKRTRMHTREASTSTGEGPGTGLGTAAAAAAAAGAAAGGHVDTLSAGAEVGQAAAAAQASRQAMQPTAVVAAPMTVEAAIAAAAAALGDRMQVPAAAAAAPAAVPQHWQQQELLPRPPPNPLQQQQLLPQQPGVVAPMPGLQASAPPPARPDRSQEIRSLLALQQQLAQCLQEHGCLLQQPQQQQQQAVAQPYMASSGSSSLAGLQQPYLQQEALQSRVQLPEQGAGQQAELQLQQRQRQVVQQYNVPEVELEQLLVLQAQLQQAVRTTTSPDS